MARGTTTNQQINGTYTAHKNQTNFSMAGWINRATQSTQQFFGFAENNTNYIGFQHATDNNVYVLCANGAAVQYGSTSQNVTGWNHYLMTFDGSQSGNANRLKFYINGTAATLSFPAQAQIQPTTSNNAAAETFRIGRLVSNNTWSSGQFSEIALWTETLSASDATALGKGIAPDKVRPDQLMAYIPLVREIIDVLSGNTLTNTDTTVANHPRVYA